MRKWAPGLRILGEAALKSGVKKIGERRKWGDAGAVTFGSELQKSRFRFAVRSRRWAIYRRRGVYFADVLAWIFGSEFGSELAASAKHGMRAPAGSATRFAAVGIT